MSYYVTCFKKYADFNGRARRKEYWVFHFVNAAIALGLGLFITKSIAVLVVFILFLLAIVIPSLAVQVRRLHDIGRSGVWILAESIPIFGLLWMFALTATDSEYCDNEYGECPKPLDSE